jgi:hypothetical protein
MEIYQDYEDLLRIFNTGKVKYLLIGAFAVSYYAQPRYTKDMDIWIEPTAENAGKVYKCLSDFGAPLNKISINDLAVKGTIFQIGVEPVRIDILTDIAGLTFKKAWPNRKKSKFGKTNTYFIGLKDLISANRAAHRLQDKVDLENLMPLIKDK